MVATKTQPAKRQPKSVNGRPPKLTVELQRTLIGALRVGTPLKTALGFVGLSDEIIYQWRNKAEAGKKVKNPSKELQAFIKFFGEVDRALHQANVSAQRTVNYLFARDLGELSTEERRLALQAAEFHLTHRLPSEYNTKTTTELTGAEGGPLFIDGKAALALLREIGEDDDDTD